MNHSEYTIQVQAHNSDWTCEFCNSRKSEYGLYVIDEKGAVVFRHVDICGQCLLFLKITMVTEGPKANL